MRKLMTLSLLLCSTTAVLADVVINELYYNPPTSQGDDAYYEYLELYNSGDSAVDMSSWAFTTGIEHTFASGTSIAAGEFLVLAQNADSVMSFYGISGVIQWDSGGINNSGETLTLVDDLANEMDSVTYDDASPWPTSPDGSGPSLELIHPSLNNGAAESWAASIVDLGTPGAQNSVYAEPGGAPVISELTMSPDSPMPGEAVSVSCDVTDEGSVTQVLLEWSLNGVTQAPISMSEQRAAYTGQIPAQAAGSSIELFVRATDNDSNETLSDTLSYNVCDEAAGIVINEIFYNPSTAQGADEDFEFIELYNPTGASVDLSGWSFTAGIEHVFAAGTSIDDGEFLVLAQNADSVMSYYGISGVIQWDSGAISNGGEQLQLVNACGSVADDLSYEDGGDWPIEADGYGPSLELYNPLLDNAIAGNWTVSLVDGGTPGAINSIFQNDAPPLLENMSFAPQSPTSSDALVLDIDATDDQGIVSVMAWIDNGSGFSAYPMSQVRSTWTLSTGPWADGDLLEIYFVAEDTGANSTRYPDSDNLFIRIEDNPVVDGDIVINEIKSGDDCFGGTDWFELVNTIGESVDLSHWILKDDDDAHSFVLPAGTTLGAGEYLVIAEDALATGSDYGITNILGDLSFGLSQSGDAVRVFNVNGVLIDEVWYDVVAPWPLPPAGQTNSLSLINPALDNNQGASWQASATPCGTPGAANNSDTYAPNMIAWGAVAPTDILIGFDEDLGAACIPTVGNYLLDGVPAASAIQYTHTEVQITFNVNMGSGFVGTLEVSGVCDEAGNPMEPRTVTINVVPSGALIITEIHQNPAAVSDDFGEFFEIYNWTAQDINLKGVELYDLGSDYVLLEEVLVPAHAYFVFGQNGDPALNGGLTVDYVYGNAFTLGNGDDEIVLRAGYNMIDQLAYDGGSEWPDPNGISMELIEPFLDNNLGANWVESTLSYGAGDLGTPGAPNSTMLIDAPQIEITLSGQDVLLNWEAVSGASAYAVYVTDSPYNGTWTLLASTAETSYTDVNAVSNSGHYYQVLSVVE